MEVPLLIALWLGITNIYVGFFIPHTGSWVHSVFQNLAAPGSSIFLCFIQGFFVLAYRQWRKGETHQAGDGPTIVCMINVVMHGFILMLYFFVGYPWWYLLVVGTNTVLSLLQYQRCQLTTLQVMRLAGLPTESVAVDQSRPLLHDALAEGLALRKNFSFADAKEVSGRFGSAVGRYREKHIIVLVTSAFSFFSVEYNIYRGLPDSFVDSALPLVSASRIARVALLIAAVAIVNSASSLLHDRGWNGFPEDRSMRMSTVFKTCLSMEKVVLTYVLTNQESSFVADDPVAFYLLVLSTLASFTVAAVLTWPGLKSDAVEILKQKGQLRPSMLLYVMRALWFFTKAGSAVAIIGVAGGFFVDDRGAQGKTVGFPAGVGLGFAAGTMLVNELTALSQDPEKDFGAVRSAAGVRILACFMTFVMLVPMALSLFLMRFSGVSFYTAFTCCCLFGIWLCALGATCVANSTPVDSDGTSPLLQDGRVPK